MEIWGTPFARKQSGQPRLPSFRLSLPVSGPREGANLLESVFSGGMLGTGTQTLLMGVQLPKIRFEYEMEIQKLVAGFEKRKNSGMNPKELARWVVKKRTDIARSIRFKQGILTKATLEVRDNFKYGPGGRTFNNIIKQKLSKGAATLDDAYKAASLSALKSNPDISQAAYKGAKFLKAGGKILVVTSIATTAYFLLTASPKELEKRLAEEVGSFAGGFLGAKAGVGICLVFGIATGGWGLLACGVVGGFAGGFAGSYFAEKLYLSHSNGPIQEADSCGTVKADHLLRSLQLNAL